MKRKMVIVRQQDSTDCGPCALQSIVQYFGGYVSLEKIRDHAYTNHNGTTVYHLVKAANKYGLEAIAKKYLDNQIDNIKLPAIVHIRYDNGMLHFMCLYKITKDAVVLMDPAKGKVVLSKIDFMKIFTGVTIEFSARCDVLILEKESSIYHLFLNIIKNNKRLCLNLIGCSIMFTILTIFSGLYFKFGYEYIQNGSFENTIKYIIYLFLIICILKCLFDYFKNYYENHLNKNIDVSILSNFVTHIFKLPLKVINTRPIGEIISRINEICGIKEVFSQLFVSSFLELILSVGSIILLFLINNRLSLILCLMMFCYTALSIMFNSYLYQRIRQNIDCQTEVNSTLIENLNMIHSVKHLNKVSLVLEKLEKVISSWIYDSYTFNHVLNTFEFFRNSIYELGLFIINSLGFYYLYIGQISFVDLVIFNTLSSYFCGPLKNIVALLPKFNFLRASFKKICDFVDLEEENVGVLEDYVNGNIKFNNVDFSYNDYSKILNDFSLEIKKGEKVMLKGSSGCGKSTLCQLLQRNYQVANGTITINKKNIMDYSLTTLRKHIVYVGQKENLYTDTIKNNILFDEDDDSNFDKVCKICLINNIVDKKSFRYDFGIDANFANVSGGEKQRIVLARALLKGGDIIILDEALSEVDFFSERKIINNLKQSYPDKTLIYISHKRHDDLFDRVINMEAK